MKRQIVGYLPFSSGPVPIVDWVPDEEPPEVSSRMLRAGERVFLKHVHKFARISDVDGNELGPLLEAVYRAMSRAASVRSFREKPYISRLLR